MSFPEIKDRLLALYGGLDRRQKLLAAGLGVVFVAVAALTLGVSRQTPMAVAFSGLTQEDAAGIVGLLQEKGIPYEISGNESVVKVPASQVHDIRLEMAGAGLPSGGTVGFEIFDSTNLGMTDFTQQLNYRRGLEGELARTIASLDAVQEARVHIVIPQPTIYSDLEKAPTASVLLKLAPGRRLDEDQVQGITHLVSSSVEGLAPGDITVLDTRGVVLNDGMGGSEQQVSDERLKAQQSYENALEAKVVSMLDAALGPGKAVVTINALFDWTHVETSREAFEAPTPGTEAVRSSREIREATDSSLAAAEGAPGVDSNLPSVPSYSGTSSLDQGTSDSTDQTGAQRSDLTYNYELSKVVSHSVQAPGRLERLSVSVLVDGIEDEEQLASIRQAIIAAAGVSAERGDSLILESLAFDRSFMETQEAEMAKVAKQDLYMTVGRWGALAVACLAVILVVRGMVLRVLPAPPPRALRATTINPLTEALEAGAAALQLPGGQGALDRGGDQRALSDVANIQHQLIGLAQKQPELVAQVIQFWLNDSAPRRRG